MSRPCKIVQAWYQERLWRNLACQKNVFKICWVYFAYPKRLRAGWKAERMFFSTAASMLDLLAVVGLSATSFLLSSSVVFNWQSLPVFITTQKLKSRAGQKTNKQTKNASGGRFSRRLSWHKIQARPYGAFRFCELNIEVWGAQADSHYV